MVSVLQNTLRMDSSPDPYVNTYKVKYGSGCARPEHTENVCLITSTARRGKKKRLILQVQFFFFFLRHAPFWVLIPIVLQIKTGAPCRSERLAKYNQLMRSVSPLPFHVPSWKGEDGFKWFCLYCWFLDRHNQPGATGLSFLSYWLEEHYSFQ